MGFFILLYIYCYMDNKLVWFARRINDPYTMKHLGEIVDEGFDYDDPCSYIDRGSEYLYAIVYGATHTFINSYEPLYNLNDEGIEYIYNFIERKFGRMIMSHYDFWVNECDD